MAKKDKTTGNGGNRGYKMVRSKVVKGPDGYGKVITKAREQLLRKLGYDPGYNKVAMHEKGGSHHGEKQGKVKWGSRKENSSDAGKTTQRKKKRKK